MFIYQYEGALQEATKRKLNNELHEIVKALSKMET